MELKLGTISRSVKVGRFDGLGPMLVPTPRGEVKMWHGDHLVEVEYARPLRRGEPGFNEDEKKNGSVTKRTQFVCSEDAARALGIHLSEPVEVERVRLEKEAAEKKAAAEEAARQKAAASTPPSA